MSTEIFRERINEMHAVESPDASSPVNVQRGTDIEGNEQNVFNHHTAPLNYPWDFGWRKDFCSKTVEHEGFFAPCLYLIPQFRPGENQMGKGEV